MLLSHNGPKSILHLIDMMYVTYCRLVKGRLPNLPIQTDDQRWILSVYESIGRLIFECIILIQIEQYKMMDLTSK